MPDDQLTLDKRLAGRHRKDRTPPMSCGLTELPQRGGPWLCRRDRRPGLREHFPGGRVAIVTRTGGRRTEPERVVGAAASRSLVALHRPPGKGSASGRFHRPSACSARVAARSSTRPAEHHAAVDRTAPHADHDQETPTTSRRCTHGIRRRAITNSVAYRSRARSTDCGGVSRSARVRLPRRTSGTYLDRRVWDSDVARFGIDIFMTTTAMVRGAKVGAGLSWCKDPRPKEPDRGPGADVHAGRRDSLPHGVPRTSRRGRSAGSRDVPVIGDPCRWSLRPCRRTRALRERSTLRARESSSPGGKEILSAAVRRTLDAKVWARFVFDHLAAALRKPTASEQIAAHCCRSTSFAPRRSSKRSAT